MSEVYKSKVGFAGIFPLFLIGGLFGWLTIMGVWPAVIILLCVGGFLLHIFLNTYYTIAGNELKVKCGFLINATIDIDRITKIAPTNSILSSPALSMDRLEIFYNKFDSIIVSPEDKAGFIAQLKALNSNIEVASTES
jgi:hypothetical protein